MSLWIQRTVTLAAQPRGFHLITPHLLRSLPEIGQIGIGLLNIFIQHTSASLTLNENASPEVRADLESSLNVLVPEDFPYEHSLEGSDDMPAHIKASLFGPSLTIPIRDGRLATGTWQGIYLCEHRNHGGQRRVVLTLQGQAGGI
ncbi:MAG: secondary thiamine-phosphate synthase enzyme YjbQ [Planctomycetes bacterium]|jgi:secondary thiamine-phosphate synthase enzyme|nr:secondary thiamine-phosphate synthase enzyme YjbQ [Planctomycetota bacterium]